MEKYLLQIISYLSNVCLASLNQIFILFGPLLVIGFLLNFSAVLTARMSVRFWGRNIFLYGFAWLGCSVHELSHAFFALIFGHTIKEIVLFKPNNDGESLGHVSHSFNKRSIYQKIGNFLIGIAPLLSGGIVLYLFTLILYHIDVTTIFPFRITTRILTDKLVLMQFASVLRNSFLTVKILLFTSNSVVWWKSGMLLYVLYSVGSSMTLSKSDLKGAFTGFIWFVVFILIFNLLTLWIGSFAAKGAADIAPYLSAFYFLLILSCITNLVFIVVFFFLNLLKNLFIRRS